MTNIIWLPASILLKSDSNIICMNTGIGCSEGLYDNGYYTDIMPRWPHLQSLDSNDRFILGRWTSLNQEINEWIHQEMGGYCVAWQPVIDSTNEKQSLAFHIGMPENQMTLFLLRWKNQI
jgi:hypothetical protein